MAKICPNCGTENPSAANFCMKCNTKLIDEQTQLSEEDRLRIELAEQNKVKALLDNENSRLKNENSGLNDEVTALKEQVEQMELLENENVKLSEAMKDKDASIKKMQSEITHLKKKKRHVGLIFFLIISLIAVGILSLTTGNLTGEIDRLRDELRDDDIRYSQQVTELEANLTEAKSKIDSLESNNGSRIESLTSDVSKLKEENQKLKRRPKSFWVRRIDCYDHTFLLQLYYDNAPSKSIWYHEGGDYVFD
ncbi:MAG: zinc-ribbon domain-containing protein [Bacteroidales bacterium]|nr:zinc-ribbon domain-containing protein [Bacteroidales bacterium]